MSNDVFKRYELKYLMNKYQYDKLMELLQEYAIPDEYGESTVCSLYYDTPNKVLIRRSLDKPAYKEKLRLRSYGTAKKDDKVFLELKKKYEDIVYKRRISIPLSEAEMYLQGKADLSKTTQIGDEIDYFMKFYKNIEPSMLLFYDRKAFVLKEDRKKRITFDRNILYRDYDLNLSKGIYGTRIIKPDEVLMELKVSDSIPLWLAKKMNELKIYKTSFSKYGTAYIMSEKERMKNCG